MRSQRCWQFLRSQEIDGIIGLGDFVTDGPFPQTDDGSAPRNAGGVSVLSGARKPGGISAGKYPASAELEGGFFDERASGLHVSESYRIRI